MKRRLAIFALLLLPACVERRLRPQPPVIPTPVRLAVLPFRFEPTGIGTVPVPDDASATAARMLAGFLGDAGVTVIDPEHTADAATALADADDIARARAIGTRLDATVVAFGIVRRYVERTGTGYGASAPASVAYEIVTRTAADGVVLGTDRFDYTQAPLSENLLDLPAFVEGGGRWRTRAEILERALGESAKRLARWLTAPAR